MFFALAFALCAIVATVRYPPIGVCICLLLYDFVTMSEVFTFLSYGSNVLPFSLMLACHLGSIYRIVLLYRAGKVSNGMLTVVVLALGCGAYPLFSILAWKRGTADVLDYGTYIMQAGPVLVLPVIAFGNDRLARVLVACTVAVQMLLALMVIKFPIGGLDVLNSANYHKYASAMGGISESGVISRAVGQFSTPIQFSMYATMCFAIGLVVAGGQRNRLARAAGVALAVLGLWGEYQSLTRGALLALVFALALACFPARGWKAVAVAGLVMALLVPLGDAFIPPSSSTAAGSVAEYIREVTDPDSDTITYRKEGMENGLKIVGEEPVFGICSMEGIIQRGKICHLYPLWFAAVYGIPCGLAALLLFLYAIAGDFRTWAVGRESKAADRLLGRGWAAWDRFLGTVFGWTSVVLLSTNFIGGRSLTWIMLGFACLASTNIARRPVLARTSVGPSGPAALAEAPGTVRT